MEIIKNKHEILESSNYSIFNLKKDNRDISESHVENLSKEMKIRGFAPSKSIQIDSNYNIIDGQHRFLAAQKLGIPVLYIIDDTLDFLLANKNQRQIVTHDFVKYYTANGHQDFIKLSDTCKKYNIDSSRGCFLYSEEMTSPALIRKGKYKFIDLSEIEIDELTKYYLNHDNFVKNRKLKPRCLGNHRNILFLFNIFYRSKMFQMEDFESNIHFKWKSFIWDTPVKHLIKEFLKIYNYHKSTYKVEYSMFIKKFQKKLKLKK